MLAEIASIQSRRTFLDAAGRFNEIPADFAPREYGPVEPNTTTNIEAAAQAEADKIARAKAVADELR